MNDVVESRPLRLPVINVDRVVVMDDDTVTRSAVRDIINSFGGTAFEASSEEEVLTFAEKYGVKNFILDIHMGDDRNSEGLDTLEKLKAFHPDIFVGMLSNHPEQFREMADNLDCDVFRAKTPSRIDDVQFILGRMLAMREHEIDIARQSFSSPEVCYGTLRSSVANSSDREVDPNVAVLSALMDNADWLASHENMYVAIVEAKVVAVGEDRMTVITEARERFPAADRLVELVPVREETVEIWSPFSAY